MGGNGSHPLNPTKDLNMLNGDKRELAYITRVLNTESLDGYSKVHLVTVLGWKCVTPINICKDDLVIYFEVDSLLPSSDVRFSFLASKKFRIKPIKICGVVSQGLVLPLSDFPELKNCKEGDFVTNKLHVEKYDSEPVCENQPKQKVSDFQRAIDRHQKFFNNAVIRFAMKFRFARWLLSKIFVHKKDKAKCKWPEWLPKTGSERIQNLPQLLGSDETYIITEKVDGASTSFILDEKNNYFVGSHNVIKNPEGSDGGNYFKNNIWAESGAKYNMQELLKSLKIVHGLKTVAIQGETYGDKVQKRNYSLNNNKHDFVVFHIWFDGKRLPIKEMIKICEDRRLPHVHVYDYDYKIPKSVEEIVDCVDSCKSAIDNGDIEGFVFYSQDGQQNFKCVSPNFLLKYHR